jgi:HSP20 family protein
MTTTAMEKRERQDLARPERIRGGWTYQPAVDILERTNEFVLRADMPGVASNGIDVRYENGTLTIQGQVQPRQPQDTNYWLREYGVGDFYRSFQLGDIIDANGISAECTNGVLTVHLPKIESARPRKIVVKEVK